MGTSPPNPCLKAAFDKAAQGGKAVHIMGLLSARLGSP